MRLLARPAAIVLTLGSLAACAAASIVTQPSAVASSSASPAPVGAASTAEPSSGATVAALAPTTAVAPFVAEPARAGASLPGLVDVAAPEPIGESFLGCDAKGDHRGDRALNALKNRTDEPIVALPMTFADVLRLPMPDRVAKRRRAEWHEEARRTIAAHEGRQVVVDGFFFDAKKEGAESPNCHDKDDRQRDFHVWLIAGPKDDRAGSIVVEVTPRARARHPAWTLSELRRIAKHRFPVRVTGFLMFDQEHPEQLRADGPRDATRATLWEIHPILEIEVEDEHGRRQL